MDAEKKKLKMFNDKNVPKFCTQCGCEMIETKFHWGYDRSTGEKRSGTRLKCSHPFLRFFHETYEFSPEGNEVIHWHI